MQFLKNLLPVVAGLGLATAIQLNAADPASIKTASSQIVYDMLKTWYTGNTSSNPLDYGSLPQPYYWWEAGAMFGGLVDYAHYTGDASYDETIAEAIVSQSSQTNDFMLVDSLAAQLGNDDILFWAITAMNAAEYNFHVPAGNSTDAYFQLSRNVFNLMVSRWNTTTCNGGLKWQFIPQNNGFYYKSTITNSMFFQLAARLGRMTGNQTYFDWASKTYDWMVATNYIDSDFQVYDGAGDQNQDNCKSVDPSEWSYNMGSTIAGAAYMYNATGDATWKTRTEGFLNAVQVRFVQPYPNATNIIYERDCEDSLCTTDRLSFKAYLAQSLGKTAVMYPGISSTIMTILKTSAVAAAKTCSGGSTGRLCGTKWYIGEWDGSQGVGQQMTAFQVISSLLVSSVSAPIKQSDHVAGQQPSSSSIVPTSTSIAVTRASSTQAPTSITTASIRYPSTTLATSAISTQAVSPSASIVGQDGIDTVKGGQDAEVGFLANPGALLSDCLCMPA